MINLYNGDVWQWHESLMPGWYTSEEAYNEAKGITPEKVEAPVSDPTDNEALPKKKTRKKK